MWVPLEVSEVHASRLSWYTWTVTTSCSGRELLKVSKTIIGIEQSLILSPPVVCGISWQLICCTLRFSLKVGTKQVEVIRSSWLRPYWLMHSAQSHDDTWSLTVFKAPKANKFECFLSHIVSLLHWKCPQQALYKRNPFCNALVRNFKRMLWVAHVICDLSINGEAFWKYLWNSSIQYIHMYLLKHYPTKPRAH